MRQLPLLIITILLIGICCPGYAENIDVKQTLINDYGLTDDDILDKFIETNSITINTIKDLNIYYLYDEFKSQYSTNEYSIDKLVFFSDTVQSMNFDIETTERILVLLNMGSEIRIEVYDNSANIHYIGDGECLHTMNAAEQVSMSEDEFDDIKSFLIYNGIENWNPNYYSDGVSNTAWTSWLLALEDAQGTVVRYSGSGSKTEAYPDNFESIFSRLLTYSE